MMTGFFFLALAAALVAALAMTLRTEGDRMLAALRGDTPIAADRSPRVVSVSWNRPAPMTRPVRPVALAAAA